MDTRTLHFWHECFLLSSQTSEQTQSSPCCVTGSASLEGKSTLPIVIPAFTVMPRVDIPLHGNDRRREPSAISMDTQVQTTAESQSALDRSHLCKKTKIKQKLRVLYV